MSVCDEEPCKSLIDDYWATTIEASEAELGLRLLCDLWKAAMRGYWALFALWAAAFAYAGGCAALYLPPWLCTGVTVASFLLLLALVGWGARILWLRREVRAQERICSRLYSEMLS